MTAELKQEPRRWRQSLRTSQNVCIFSTIRIYLKPFHQNFWKLSTSGLSHTTSLTLLTFQTTQLRHLTRKITTCKLFQRPDAVADRMCLRTQHGASLNSSQSYQTVPRSARKQSYPLEQQTFTCNWHDLNARLRPVCDIRPTKRHNPERWHRCAQTSVREASVGS